MAPFWRGLNDFSETWAEHQIIAAARGLPVPAADETPDPDLVPRPPPPQSESSQNLQNLTVPMGPRTLSTASDKSGSGTASPGGTKGSSFKPGNRAKAIANVLSGNSRNASSADLTPKEMKLPHDPFVNGQALEVFLYKNADECPICFLTYPPYLNKTRCCDQAICSECFVQIKRADPHVPEYHPNGEARDPNEGLQPEDPPEHLISEPAACPYCQQPEFGVTYDPPPFRRGLVYSGSTTNLGATPMSSQSSLHSSQPTSPGRRRAHSLSAAAPNVITTDRVRPDWAAKLQSARQHQARRAAAATALHTAAFLTGDSEQSRTSILRPGRFSRRNTSREQTNASGSSDAAAGTEGDSGEQGEGSQRQGGRTGRRSRMDELEDMMFAEAVRLSLAAEEDRKRKEEKALRKEAKKQQKEREKEEKKAAKKQASSPYGGSAGASGSSLSLGGFGRRRGNSAASNLRMEATVQGASQSTQSGETSPMSPVYKENFSQEDISSDKGKGVDRGASGASTPEEGGSSTLPVPISRGGSHLRQMSNASSVGSSIDTPSGSYTGQGADGTNPRASGLSVQGEDGDGNEPLWNFRSLAEIVGVDLDAGQAQEDGESPGTKGHPSTGRPLSQIGEDDKEEAEAEHVEERKVQHPLAAQAANTSRPDDGTPSPELTISPVTPTATEGQPDKQLDHQNIAEHKSQITQ